MFNAFPRKPIMEDKTSASKAHKANRKKFATEHVSWSRRTKKVIFRDEKKFNLATPDRF